MSVMMLKQCKYPRILSLHFPKGKKINQLKFLLFPVGSALYIKCMFCLRKTYVSEKDQNNVDKKDSSSEIP